ncbi:MAG: hypothetical protein QOG80_2239, partial [Pseudonocardiales bacterium]|nr:hypothetical protein [Pseudonocardiales bacterium]
LIMVATTVLTALGNSTDGPRRVAYLLAGYRPSQLFDGQLWRLPLSALLAQSWLQWAWTVLVGGALMVAVESRLGRIRAATVLSLSHIVPTVAVAFWARAVEDRSIMSSEDFGTSCLIVGAAGALLWVSRSRLLAVGLLVSFVGDIFLNSPVTIVEHIIAVGIGGVTAISLGHPPTPSST